MGCPFAGWREKQPGMVSPGPQGGVVEEGVREPDGSMYEQPEESHFEI